MKMLVHRPALGGNVLVSTQQLFPGVLLQGNLDTFLDPEAVLEQLQFSYCMG